MYIMAARELVEKAEDFLLSEAYGAAAHYFYKALMLDEEQLRAWRGLAISIGMMNDYFDTQTVLARYVLKKLPFQEELLPLSLIAFRENPRALTEWLRLTSRSMGTSKQVRKDMSEMADQLETIYLEMVEKYGIEELEEEKMISLEETAETELDLDWMLEENVEEILNFLQDWIETPQLTAMGVGMIRYFPHPRSERILRRLCRNEETDPKLKTRALIALRWLGVRGNVRLEKFGTSYIVNLDNPLPNLTTNLPENFLRILNWIGLWIAVEERIIDQEQFDLWVREPQSHSDEIEGAIENEVIPDYLLKVSETLLRNVYLHYYPEIPEHLDRVEWGTALLDLLREWEDTAEDRWKYTVPGMNSQTESRKSYILAATPDFYELIQEDEGDFFFSV